jgi:hypothetical protein
MVSSARPFEEVDLTVKLARYTVCAVVLLLAVACLTPTAAFAHATSGELASWSPHGDAPDSGRTKLRVGCADDKNRTFYASNSKTTFVNTNGHPKKVTRNALFHAIHAWASSGDCPDVHVHWKWRTRDDGTKYRYVTRLEAANLSD